MSFLMSTFLIGRQLSNGIYNAPLPCIHRKSYKIRQKRPVKIYNNFVLLLILTKFYATEHLNTGLVEEALLSSQQDHLIFQKASYIMY